MGMYTQIRGWLNVDSIGSTSNFEGIREKYQQAKDEFFERKDLDRRWVCEDSNLSSGSNSSAWIFIGSEHKNYDSSIDEWILALLKMFPSAEGRIDYQYETEEYGEEPSKSRFLLIRGGEIIEDGKTDTWCNGYGNMYK